MAKVDAAIAIAFLSLLISGWQAVTAWTERDAQLQSLVFQSQVVTMQSLVENARKSCARRICSNYADPKKEKYQSCRGDRLDNAFEKVEFETNSLKLLAPPRVVALVREFHEKVHLPHAFDREDEEFKGVKPLDSSDESRNFQLYNKCQRQIDLFVNDFRRVLGLERLSDGLLSKVGDTDRLMRQ